MAEITKTPFSWANEYSRDFLYKGYIREDDTLENRVWHIAQHAEKLLNKAGFAEKFYGYMSRGFYSLSSPVWSNFGTDRGMPVSCFGSYIEDNTSSIMEANVEIGMMSKHGGGCSAYFGEVRARGNKIGEDNGKTSGSVHFMELLEKITSIISQGGVRRGFASPYLPITHGDAMEFLSIGTEGHPLQEMTNGVTVSDDFMESILSRESRNDSEKWAKLIKNRKEVGYPYVLFSDTINRNTVDVYRDKGMTIHASNMCSEIALPSSYDESFVCVLSSMNILKYEEWKDTDAVETLTYFLDAVVTEFTDKLEKFRDAEGNDADARDKRRTFQYLERAYNFARRHRALGIGTLGWHHFLQSKMIPFESTEARKLNVEIHKLIEEKAWAASKEMAEVYGEPELLTGYGRRNTTLTAIAPTRSSSFILEQVSQSIEPQMSNYFISDLAKVKTTIINPYLLEVLNKYGKNNSEVLAQIRKDGGSIQNLDFLSAHEKDVFKTYSEIDPYIIIDQAAERQPYVDQSQSLNLMLSSSMKASQINKLYIYAWEQEIKSLYYQYGTNAAQEAARLKACATCEA